MASLFLESIAENFADPISFFTNIVETLPGTKEATNDGCIGVCITTFR